MVMGCSSARPFDGFVGDPSILSELPGRLLVLADDQGLATIRPDGSERRELARTEEGVIRSQPSWSPDGSRIAWTEIWKEAEAFLVTANSEGEELTRDPAPFGAVYVSWDPASRRVAFSGTDPEDGRLFLALAEPGHSMEVIDEGAPMWIDWSGDGSELLVHIAGQAEIVRIDGGARTLLPTDGQFRVGIHLGDRYVFTRGEEVGEMLAVGTFDGHDTTELMRVGHPTAYVIDRQHSRLAVMSVASSSTQALSREEPGDRPILAPNRLVVVNLADGEVEDVAGARAVSWSWSPDGRSLLYSIIDRQTNDGGLRWHIWDGEASVPYQRFIPTGVFGRDYLAFFDQFDLSHSFWAPDGSAFVYAGGSSDQDRGIWVQRVGEAAAVRVSEGEVALWSPVP